MPKIFKIEQSRQSIFDYWQAHANPDLCLYATLLAEQPILNAAGELLKGTAFVIFNHAIGSWEYVSEELANLSGYSVERHREEGFNLTFKYMHPDYADFAFQGCHALTFDYLYSLPVERRKEVSFTKDFQYLVYEKEYVRVLQKGMVLEMNAQGGIVKTLHLISVITHLKKNDSANLVIRSPAGAFTIYSFNTQDKTITLAGSLSRREREIFVLLARGLSTNQIAEHLFLSIHTVDTHRRKLLNKYNCVNTTALVTYAKLVGLI